MDKGIEYESEYYVKVETRPDCSKNSRKRFNYDMSQTNQR